MKCKYLELHFSSPFKIIQWRKGRNKKMLGTAEHFNIGLKKERIYDVRAVLCGDEGERVEAAGGAGESERMAI
jgi:hypothetical protein